MSLFGSATKTASERSYDTVLVAGASGEQKKLTRSDFEKLSLVERVRLLSGGQMRFFRGDEEVPSRNAMRRV